MKPFFSFVALLFLGLLIFLPKTNLYYSAEEALSSAHLYLNDEKIHEHWLYLEVEDATLLLDSMPIGSIEQIRIVPLLIYNQATIDAIEFNGEFSALFPQGIDHLRFTYTLLHPLTVSLNGVGGFGPIKGELDLSQMRLVLLFEASPIMRNYPFLLSKLRKSDEGLIYEISF